VCDLIFIINWIVRDKKYNNVYKHKHIHSPIIRNTQNDFNFVFNSYAIGVIGNYGLWFTGSILLLMAIVLLGWENRRKSFPTTKTQLVYV
jgi:hypothetical protein